MHFNNFGKINETNISTSTYRDFRHVKYRTIENDISEEEDYQIQKPNGWGKRHTLVLLGFWGYVISYAMRINLSFAIVAMVITKNRTDLQFSNKSTSLTCPDLSDATNSEENHITIQGEFDWDGEAQGILLGAFSFGYAVSQLPGGMLTDRIGGKWPFGIGILITALFSILTPMAARSGKSELFKVRVIQGLAEGIIGPAMHGLLATWLPPMETSKLGAFVYAGTRIGIVLTLPLCGILISSGFLGGWPSIFYSNGLFGIIWFVFWVIYVFNDPSDHPSISEEERLYIQHSIGIKPSKHQIPTPWKQMLTSMPVTAIVVAQVGQGWGIQTLLTELPTYMKTVLHFNVTSNGWLSALPYLIMWIVSISASWYADYVREMGIANTTLVRKVCNTIAHWIPAIALIGIAYSGCERIMVVGLLMVALGFNGFAAAGYQMNHIDIASNHAAVMSGYTNTVANLCGIAAPYMAGVITNGGGSISDWRLIFLIAAGIYIIDNLFYICFASGEEQSWNRDPNSDSYDYMREMSECFPLLSENYDVYNDYPTSDQNSRYVYG